MDAAVPVCAVMLMQCTDPAHHPSRYADPASSHGPMEPRCTVLALQPLLALIIMCRVHANAVRRPLNPSQDRPLIATQRLTTNIKKYLLARHLAPILRPLQAVVLTSEGWPLPGRSWQHPWHAPTPAALLLRSVLPRAQPLPAGPCSPRGQCSGRAASWAGT